MTPEKPRRLGRGLEALLATTQAATPTEADVSALRQIPIAQIRTNPYQPRKDFRPEDLADLENSIRATGLLQPVTVRPAPNGAPGFELIAGERRLRAATRIGWTEMPAIVKDIDDRTLLTFGLVENLQRADLNPIEEAEGYQRLVDEFDLTQQQIADVIGKDRSTVANLLRVLALPAAVRRMLQEGALSLGHARALLALGNEHAITDLARETVARQLNVREVERRAREGGAKRKPDRTTATTDDAAPRGQNTEARRIEDQLRRHLQTDVHLTVREKERGEITIAFYSNDDLARVLELMLGGPTDGF